MRAGLMGKKLLDTKECWELWHKIGSLKGVQNYLLQKGVINQRTGRPVTVAGIEKAAFTWALENQETARKDLSYAWQQEGFILTDDEWRKFLVKKARLIFYQRPGRFGKFISDNGLEDLV